MIYITIFSKYCDITKRKYHDKHQRKYKTAIFPYLSTFILYSILYLELLEHHRVKP